MQTPRCNKCGERHYNFAACPTVPAPAAIRTTLPGDRTAAPPNFSVVTGFGQPWGNAPNRGVSEVQYTQPMRLRTGTLTYPPEKET